MGNSSKSVGTWHFFLQVTSILVQFLCILSSNFLSIQNISSIYILNAIVANFIQCYSKNFVNSKHMFILNINIIHIFMFFYNTVYFFTPGASMWFYFRVSWKDPIVHSTCRYGMVAIWAIQNISGHLASWNNTISGWICGKLHPTTINWNTKSILSLRAGEYNGAYHIATWAI